MIRTTWHKWREDDMTQDTSARETSTRESIDRVWELMKSMPICMLTSWTGSELHSRPLGAYVRQEENRIYFLTDVRAQKDDEVAKYPKVNLGFADTGSQKYVALSGTAQVSSDRAKIKELFGTPAKAWWDSPDDPNIRVLVVTPDKAEYWDSPGKIISYVKMAVAAMTDTRPDMGDNEKVAMR
jgi:general stress protein 26